MSIFTSVKTMIVACTTSPTSAIALGVPSGSNDLKGMYFRAWTDSGQVILKFGDNAVAASKTPTSSVLADGNIPATTTFSPPQLLADNVGYVSAVAQSGTPNLYIEVGTLHN
jgi:hypothetical protein